jgi:GH25 family lysozyme M1 (1,4-beta-N-acetylmuramidase)
MISEVQEERANVKQKEKFMEMKLIDVSKHNGIIDWQKVKADGIEGVIIRAGYGRLPTQKDGCFEKNYAGATAAGLHVGAYWYSYATDVETAKAEARVFLAAIKGKCFDLPLYLDIEDACQLKLSKEVCTDIAINFCNVLEDAGCYCGIYSFDSFFASHLEGSISKRYSIWAARVENVKPIYAKDYDMWQYSWKGKVDGIAVDVDLDIAFKDFPEIITAKGLNGCTPPAQDEPPEQKEPHEEDESNEQIETTAPNLKKVKAWKNNITEEEASKLKMKLLELGLSVSVI